jgi:hypothetical protein
MKFKPVSETEWKEIIELFNSDFGVNTICNMYHRDYSTIKKIWQTEYNPGQFRARTSRLCRLHQLGDKSHMKGKTGMKHPNAVEKVMTNGYVTVFKPEWYTGKVDGNRVYEHIVAYCEHNGLTEVPDGLVIHHMDENKMNNSPENLIMLSIADHRRLHAWLNKVQRLSRKGVGNSVPEAPDTQMGDDIV